MVVCAYVDERKQHHLSIESLTVKLFFLLFIETLCGLVVVVTCGSRRAVADEETLTPECRTYESLSTLSLPDAEKLRGVRQV